MSSLYTKTMLLPLFPLPNLVLLPGMVLPLYIFEPRYRELLAWVLSSGEPFGIVRSDPSIANRCPQARLSRVGSYAYVQQVTQHPDDTASIVVVGAERFRILNFNPDAFSYLSAEVIPYTLEPNLDDIDLFSQTVFGRFIAQQNTQRQEQLLAHAPNDPLLLSTFMATNMQLSADILQDLLETAGLSARWQYLSQLIPNHAACLN